VLKNKGVIFINEVRCLKCEKLLYKSKLGQYPEIECKCPRCGEINSSNSDGVSEIIPAVKNVNKKQVFITPEVCKQKIIDELNSKYSDLKIKKWGEMNIGGFRPFTKCSFEGILINNK